MTMKKKNVSRQQDDDDDDSVDYAAAADHHANHASDSENEEDENVDEDSRERSEGEEDDDDDNENVEKEYSEKEDESGSDDEEESSEDEIEDPNDDENSDEEETDEVIIHPPKQIDDVEGTKNPCNFDLRNLLATSTHPINSYELYKKKNRSNDSNISFNNPEFPSADEDLLQHDAEQSCQQLITALWQLPRIRSSNSAAGPPMVMLPSFDNSKIPRALPLPPPKAESKWEKFAREKGIAPKTKRSRKVWDETTQQWLYRTGYQKANNDKNKEWPIMEVPDGQDPYQDPWQVQREAKRARIDDNVSKRLKNQEQAGVLAKGTANKLLKAKNKARELGKARDKSNVSLQQLPAGVPVDLGHAKKESKTSAPEKLRGKTSTMKALIATQRSTASLGKFDKPREGEPERREVKNSKKKRKLVSPEYTKISETERNAKLLASIGDNAVAKEKDRKKGKLATGETAYDYEFSDGLGASSFRKKKGRAGAGKMKKMTKKRVK